jgi:hypothetical protein
MRRLFSITIFGDPQHLPDVGDDFGGRSTVGRIKQILFLQHFLKLSFLVQHLHPPGNDGGGDRIDALEIPLGTKFDLLGIDLL